MNKLISRNPVLRFKEGSKIRKMGLASGGGLTLFSNKNGKFYTGNKTAKGNPYNLKEITPEKIVPQKDGRTIFKINGQWYNQNGLRVVNFGNSKVQTKEKEIKETPNLTNYTRNTEYNDQYGLAGDIQRNWRGTKGVIANDDLKLLLEMGFQIQDLKNAAREAQLFIRDNGLGQYNIALDNAWGSQSSDALSSVYQMWKAKKEADAAAESSRPKSTSSPIMQLPEAPVAPTLLRQAISDYSNYAQNIKQALGGNSNFSGLSNLVWKEYADDDNSFAANFSRDMRTRFGDYKDIKSWLTNQAAIEKALNISGRYIGTNSGDYGDLANSMANWAGGYNYNINKLNLTLTNDYNKKLDYYNTIIDKYKRAVGGYKIGGILPSRNIVERFKQRNFRLVAQ